jgi:pimeloyl-ACP methyl ester carboxylesterase
MKDLANVVKSLQLEEHYLMVHSLGSLPGARYAAQYQDKVKGLFMIEPIPEGFPHWVRVGTFDEDGVEQGQKRRNGWENINVLKDRLETNKQTKKWSREVLEDILKYETEVDSDGHVSIKWHPSVYNIEEMRKDTFSLLEESPNITSPTLLMVCDDNPLVASHFNLIAEKIPNIKYVIVNGLGHAIYMEEPDLIADYAASFFLDGKLPNED